MGTYHRSTKWIARLSTIAPERLMLISDQPILEFLVRSTRRMFSITSAKFSGGLTFVVLPLLHIFKVIDASVVVILAREYNGVHIGGVGIGNRVAYGMLVLAPGAVPT